MCLQPGDILRDRYEIIKELGRGGFGVTYLARDLAFSGHPLRAIKEIPFPQPRTRQVLTIARRNFRREADALEHLGKHSQIPQLFDRFEENRKFYLVQEYIEGHSLTEEVVEGQPWSQTKVVAFLRNILNVLQVVHQHGVIHRDLKPSNLIRRNRDRKVVLVDFGAVREISSLDTTDSGTVVTTEAICSKGYTPPEQYSRPYISEPYNDIYAVGIIAIQALTGLNPNQLPTDRETGEIVWHFSTPDRPMVTVDAPLGAILNQMIRYLFKQRYTSVEDILEDLQDVEISESIAEDLQDLEISESIAEVSQPNSGRAKVAAIASTTTPSSVGSRVQTPSNSRRWNRSQLFRLGVLAVVAIAVPIALYNLIKPKTYRSQIGDDLSMGEEILLTDSSSFPKQRGVNFIARCRSNRVMLPILFRLTNFDEWQKCFGKKLNYEEALEKFRQAWYETRDPETLIYLNNAFLEAIDAQAYTIAVTVPIRRDESGTIINSEVATEILSGVAQAQMEVNLALFDRDLFLRMDGGEALLKNTKNAIEKNGEFKGIRVIVADDANQVERSKSVATSLAEVPDLLGNIGHYASEITVETLDIYDENELIVISPGSTSSSLSPGGDSECSSQEPNDFFLRTIHSTSTQAAALVDFLIQDLDRTQAAVFYNEDSAYSYCFWKDFKVRFELKGGTIAFAQGNLHKTDEFNAIQANQRVLEREDIAIVLMPDGEVTDSVDNAIDTIVANGERNWIIGGWPLYNQKILPQVAQLPSQKKTVIAVPWHPLTSPNREFPEAARQLWGISVSGNTALAYDAAQALIQAIRLQDRPTRRGMQQTLRPQDEGNEFITPGATGEIRFNPYTGNRKSLEAEWVRIVPCKTEVLGLAFVPFKYQTAADAGLQCGATGTGRRGDGGTGGRGDKGDKEDEGE